MMTALSARPIRKGLSENINEYDDFKVMFANLKQQIDNYRVNIIEVIESADLNGDLEVKITMEKFLLDFIIYLNQVNIWYKKSKEYSHIEDFDQDFASFTFI
jgi:hypothetical protein